MKRLRAFVMLTLLGGLAVILPLLLFLMVIRWIVGWLHGLVIPVAESMGIGITADSPLAFAIVLAGMLLACFLTGLLVRTPIGGWMHAWVDGWLGRLAPGYSLVRDTVSQLLGSPQGERLRGEVALVRVHGAGSTARQLGIVTARHGDGMFTVYVPTAPIPTQGFVYHLESQSVELQPSLSIEDAMRMVFGCGAGAAQLLDRSLPAAGEKGV